MKKAFSIAVSLVFAAAGITGCGATNLSGGVTPADSAVLSGTVKTGGSTSVEKVMTALIYQYQDENSEVSVNYEMNGSGDGIKNTISGLYEIGHSSRELKTDGTEDGLDAVAYAIDGIALVVNKANAVNGLTTEQVRDIYIGKIENWSEVGGEDALITVVTREASSGTRSAFAEIVGLEKADDPETSIVPNATTCDSTGAIQTAVTQNANAIGYMSFSDADEANIKILAYNGIECSEASLKDGGYTLKREFYLITKTGATLSPAAQSFVDFVLSAEGQEIVAANKLLPID
ncbi:MAG: phosphate ABC transporter substrate-binding protein [Clostridiales bacterium]|jgi:phosphate transport system substrate-binding protein|nr:phosphate ABC transporter substrate-binding protein [Clostridiales bacterium]